MIVGSRRKQRGALRTHDSAGDAPPARACAAPGLHSAAGQHTSASPPPPAPHRKTAAASDLSERASLALADGERNTKERTVRTSIHWDENTGEMRSNSTGAPPQHGCTRRVLALSSHARLLAPAAQPNPAARGCSRKQRIDHPGGSNRVVSCELCEVRPRANSSGSPYEAS